MTRNHNEKLRGPCEAVKGWDHVDGYSRMPVGIKCERPCRWRAYGVMPFGTILCDDCYVSMLLRDAERLEVGNEP